MKSILLFKEKIRSILIGRKNDLGLPKYEIYFCSIQKKLVFDDKNSDLFCDNKK